MESLTLIQIMDRFSTDETAREYLEGIRWKDGVVCPHCQCSDKAKFSGIKANPKTKVRPGLRYCANCNRQFTVTVGTIFEDSHIPLRKWLIAWYLLCSSKKGISALQIQRTLELGSYRTAWLMMHKIRHALKDPAFKDKLSGTVEIDETYVGGKPRPGTGKHKRGRGTKKAPVVALIQRGGNVRTKVVTGVSHKNLREFVNENVAATATVNTDQFPTYPGLLKGHAKHEIVNHTLKEFSRKNADGTSAHVNTCESFFCLIKRGVMGTFHHVSKQHLPRYCDEFAFRWNHRAVTDGERMIAGLQRAEGKRLQYKA